jgi:hypothetical protein
MAEGVLTDLSPDALVGAIEENQAEFLLALGRAGGGEERRDRHVGFGDCCAIHVYERSDP